jgi:SRSO17 transposase
MPQDQHITPLLPATTLAEVCRWAQELLHLHARLAPRFTRPEPRRRALRYLQGILSETARKNGWQLAEHAREGSPDGMQRLLSDAVWDTNGVRDDLRAYAVEHLGQESAILVIDETSFPKRGKQSAGVGVQYCGATGQVDNCQVGVFLSYVTARGHTLIDRELYLPFDWLEDRDRCRAAAIPETVHFQTKPEQAVQMLERIFQAHLPISWIVADTVYGSNLDLRTWLEEHQYPYVLAVACDEPVGIRTPDGHRRRVEAREVEALLLQEQEWQRLCMSEGTKGPRLFDWARVPVLHRWQDDGCHWLLIRRSLSDPYEQRYSLVFALKGSTLQEMVQASGARWHIEEEFANAKDMGLDHYQVRSYLGWYRHITLVLVALAYLAGMCVTASGSLSPTALSQLSSPSPVLVLSIPEVRHLLARLIWPLSSSARLVLAWSWWRCSHQRRASYYHRKRRLKTG